MKSQKKILVSDELIAERINDCGTFSEEYLDALTGQQWETLRAGRISRLGSLKHNVFINERKLGILSEMEEHRFMRVKNVAHREKQIRDLYFSIEPKNFRIAAINDLCAYDKALLKYYRSTILHEAINRYEAVRRRIILTDWKEWFSRIVTLIFYTAAITFPVYIAHTIFIGNSNVGGGLARFGEGYFGSLCIFVLIDSGLRRWKNFCEERDRLIDWKIAKARLDIDDTFAIFSGEISTHNLFSDQEMLTGERSGELSPKGW
jgi:hypothetical protein